MGLTEWVDTLRYKQNNLTAHGTLIPRKQNGWRRPGHLRLVSTKDL